ncbi:endonuclease [Flavobacterium orientale]|uniref:Ribonuclease n=1 Tax=Flavobacterium orientale TaxID=1756020 RepID=A0A916XVQ7_9FLAO|nr:endonuclease [Flavobacterium orientale]GGD16328.1 ribonuclease [Flavobacterium orientale]
MKFKITFLFVFSTVVAFAQPPAGYYNSATGTGYTLKTQLYNIINNHTDQGYNSIDNFFPLADLDVYYENDNTILDIYSENPNGPDPYNFFLFNACGNYSGEGDCFNKEHIIPQSVFSSNSPMRGDAHHLLPTDGRVNGFRGNYPFGIVGQSLISQSGISNPTQNGSKAGNNINTGVAAGYSGVVFEPIDEFKGDVARIYFYFVTRYENLISSWSSYPMFDGSSNKVLSDPFLGILYSWHINDPVSQKEINRNNAIYAYQGNRNPFVDNPDYVCNIWNVSNCTLSVPEINFENAITVYPNPSNNQTISIESSIELDEIQLISINGQLLQVIQKENITANQLQINSIPSGFYLLKVKSNNQYITKKIIIN